MQTNLTGVERMTHTLYYMNDQKQNKTKLSQLPLKKPKCEWRFWFETFTFQPTTLTPEHWALIGLNASVLMTAIPLLLTLAARSDLVKVRINHTRLT